MPQPADPLVPCSLRSLVADVNRFHSWFRNREISANSRVSVSILRNGDSIDGSSTQRGSSVSDGGEHCRSFFIFSIFFVFYFEYMFEEFRVDVTDFDILVLSQSDTIGAWSDSQGRHGVRHRPRRQGRYTAAARAVSFPPFDLPAPLQCWGWGNWVLAFDFRLVFFGFGLWWCSFHFSFFRPFWIGGCWAWGLVLWGSFQFEYGFFWSWLGVWDYAFQSISIIRKGCSFLSRYKWKAESRDFE